MLTLTSFPNGQRIPPHIIQFDPGMEAWNKLKLPSGQSQSQSSFDGHDVNASHWDCIRDGLYFQNND